MEAEAIMNKNLVDSDLVSFFDLLAHFDFEDKKKEKSVSNPDLLVSAPKRSGLDSDT